ncbi:MAG: hypothetical protein OZ927_07350 [Alcaligenaceae bacterium]|nr:hypothetical protein [Alcaligenaceae bacterium]
MDFVIEKAGALLLQRAMIFLLYKGRSKMPICRADDVNAEPVVFLTPWRVFRLEDGSRHLCGGAGFLGGRVSSAVMSIDHENATVVTRSGRIYVLVGEPGLDADADDLWEEWTAFNNVVSWKDVTEEVWSEIQVRQQP